MSGAGANAFGDRQPRERVINGVQLVECPPGHAWLTQKACVRLYETAEQAYCVGCRLGPKRGASAHGSATVEKDTANAWRTQSCNAPTSAAWLRDKRETLGLSQAQMAAKLGVHPSHYGNMETGERRVMSKTRAVVQKMVMMAARRTRQKIAYGKEVE